MSDLIDRQMAITHVYVVLFPNVRAAEKADKALRQMPTVDAVEVVRCKDCVHQVKVFQEDKRRKGGGYYYYDCGLADGYSHVGLDDDFCSMGKRRTDEQT